MSAVLKIQDNSDSKAVSASELIRNPSLMSDIGTLAEIMASSRVTVPKHLQGNTGDCFAIVMQAAQWKMSPFSVAQKTHLVNGVLGYEAQLINAVIQTSGAITGRFHYEYTGEGETLACRVGAVIRGETEIIWSEWLTARSVSTKNSPLWKTNPKQQMGYLQVKNWARLYCPGAILGVYSEDELPNEVEPKEKIINPIQEEYKKPELAFCSDETFTNKAPEWHALIESGKQTANRIISMVESKYLFTEDQKEEIRSWENTVIEGEIV
jgi:RecT family